MPGLLQVNAQLCRDQLSNPEPPLMLPQRERLLADSRYKRR